MVVLKPDQRIVRRLVGERGIHAAIVLPELVDESQIRQKAMTEWPEDLITIAIIIVIHFIVGQPEPLERVSGITRWHADTAGLIRDSCVGIAVSPRDPRAIGLLYYWIESRCQPASWFVNDDLPLAIGLFVGVGVGLAIRSDDQVLVTEEGRDVIT